MHDRMSCRVVPNGCRSVISQLTCRKHYHLGMTVVFFDVLSGPLQVAMSINKDSEMMQWCR